jgi:phage replication-related protein YjqB (UPF0714/DUF867 family)
VTEYVPDARDYRGYADLARWNRRGVDYEICSFERPGSTVAVLAPHGGAIEDGTSEIARAIAGEDFNLYLLEGRRPELNYRTLHLTSHRFDEPECLRLLTRCPHVVAVHGCEGVDQVVLLGGLDTLLRDLLADALRVAGIVAATDGHRFPATHPDNICNRGVAGRGVQIEVPHALRRSTAASRLACVVREALLELRIAEVVGC